MNQKFMDNVTFQFYNISIQKVSKIALSIQKVVANYRKYCMLKSVWFDKSINYAISNYVSIDDNDHTDDFDDLNVVRSFLKSFAKIIEFAKLKNQLHISSLNSLLYFNSFFLIFNHLYSRLFQYAY